MKLLGFKKKIKSTVLTAVLILSGTFAHADSIKNENNVILFSKDFYISLSTLAFYQRDSYLESLIKKTISARGILDEIDRKAPGKIRATIHDIDSEKYGFKILYYLYFTDNDFNKSLKAGERYFFKGKILVWTHLDSQRKELIFDIIPEGIFLEKN